MQEEQNRVYQWFYGQGQLHQLTGTAQRLWCCLYQRLGVAHANRFYEMSSRDLAQELGVCLKSVERSRKALQAAGLLHYEVRGKSVYYMLLLPEQFVQERENASCAANTQCSFISTEDKPGGYSPSRDSQIANETKMIEEDSTLVMLQQLEAKLQEYAILINQLQAQLTEQYYDRKSAYSEIAQISTQEHNQETEVRSQSECGLNVEAAVQAVHVEEQEEPVTSKTESVHAPKTTMKDLLGFHGDSLHDQVYMKVLQSRQFLDKAELERLPAQPLEVCSSQEYCAYKQEEEKEKKLPDILFNDKYEILLWEYLDKYKDSRFAEACYNHFSMVKELYKRRKKKGLTEFGFYSIMEQLERISGDDMTLKLAMMERSLRNGWIGFFELMENTPEYYKMEKKKQGRKRSNYRKQYDGGQYQRDYSCSHGEKVGRLLKSNY